PTIPPACLFGHEKGAFSRRSNGMAAQFSFMNGRSIGLTCIVNGLGDELFSGAGFSFDEDSRVGGRDLLHLVENRFEGSAIADDRLECSLNLIRPRVYDCC